MSDSTEEPIKLSTEASTSVTIFNSPNQFVGYANINGVTVTPDEVIMHFGLRRTDEPTEADGVAKIYLNLPHAKRIMLVLNALIAEHEMMFGEIHPEPEARLTDAGRKRLQENLRKLKDAGQIK